MTNHLLKAAAAVVILVIVLEVLGKVLDSVGQKRDLNLGRSRVTFVCTDRWYGVTYAADKPGVVAALREMAAQGKYPDGLWNK